MRRKFNWDTLLLILLGATLFAPSASAQGKSEYSILEKLLQPTRTAELRVELEGCIADLGFVSHVTVFPKTTETKVKIVVTNKSRMTISGLVVQSNDPRALGLGLDGKSIIEFGKLAPDQSITHIEFVAALDGIFTGQETFSIVAVDVIDSSGREIVSHIFETRWPSISSDEDLLLAETQLCNATL